MVHVEKTYYVYIMASQRRVLYIGITSHIERRVRQHKSHAFGGFTAKYNVTDLVYFERYDSVGKAIERWRRKASGPDAHQRRADLQCNKSSPGRHALVVVICAGETPTPAGQLSP